MVCYDAVMQYPDASRYRIHPQPWERTMLTITSNYQPYNLIAACDLPDELFAPGADLEPWAGEKRHAEHIRFFRAYGSWHCVDEFEAINRGISVMVAAPTPADRGKLDDWHGVQGQSHSTAIVIRWVNNFEDMQVGYAQWWH